MKRVCISVCLLLAACDTGGTETEDAGLHDAARRTGNADGSGARGDANTSLTTGPAPLGMLVTRDVMWSTGGAMLGHVSAIAQSGTTAVYFGDAGAVVLTAGAWITTDASVRAWRSATVIPAADRSGEWIVAVDGDGQLRRLANQHEMDGVSDRYGLDAHAIERVFPLGDARVGFALEHGFAVTDGTTVQRYDAPTYTNAAGASGRMAGIVGANTVGIFDAVHARAFTYAIDGAALTGFDGDGKLLVTTARELWREDANGSLARVYESDRASARIHGLAVDGDRVWLAEDTELVSIQHGERARTTGLALAPGAVLAPTGTAGEVWALGGEIPRRIALVSATLDDRTRWSQTVQPAFARACTPCHLEGGEAEVDLSVYEAWQGRRATIHTRVIVRRDMPPTGHTVDDEGREAIRAFTESQ